MSLILLNLYLSSVQFAKDGNFLVDKKIKFVLIAAKGLKRYFPGKIIYKQLQIKDNPGALIIKHFPEALEFIHSNKQIAAVLVHCLGGKSRSVTIIIAYLMFLERLKSSQAIDLLKTKYITVLPNEGFRKQLSHWEVILSYHYKHHEQFDFQGLKYSLDQFDISKFKIVEIMKLTQKEEGTEEQDDDLDQDDEQYQQEQQLFQQE